MQQLGGIDALFLRMEQGNCFLHIGPVMVYGPAPGAGGKAPMREIRAALGRLAQRSGVFRRKLMEVPGRLDRPWWVDDPGFRLADHLTRTRLPRPGDAAQLRAAIARLHAEPLPRDRPLWAAHVIEGLDACAGLPRGSFALYLKNHHAALDGATGVEAVQVLHARGTRAAAAAAPTAVAPRRAQVLLRAVRNNLQQPLRLARAAGHAVDALRAPGVQPDDRPPLLLPERTRFNARVSAQRTVGWIETRLGQHARIRACVPGATVNDVCLATVSGALGRYLADKGERPAGSLVAAFPINVRAPAQMGAGGNVVSAGRLSLCSSIADPLARLAAVHASSVAAKAAHERIGGGLFEEIATALPDLAWTLAGRVVASGVVGRIDPVLHTLVTNVPGSREPLALGGARMRLIAGLGPCFDGAGLFHAVSSYCDVLTIGFQACAAMLPDPEVYESCLRASFDELQEAADRRARTPEKRRARA